MLLILCVALFCLFTVDSSRLYGEHSHSRNNLTLTTARKCYPGYQPVLNRNRYNSVPTGAELYRILSAIVPEAPDLPSNPYSKILLIFKFTTRMVFAVHSTVPTVVMMIVPEELPPPEKGMLLEAAEHTMGRSSRRPCSGQWLHLAVLIMCAGSPFVQGQSTTAPAATAATAPLTTPAPPTNIPQSFACFNCLFQPDGVTPKVVRASKCK